MVRDCDIHQADGDDPDYPCMMVEQQPIEDIVTAAMLVVESRDIGVIGTTRHSCREISQHLVHPVSLTLLLMVASTAFLDAFHGNSFTSTLLESSSIYFMLFTTTDKCHPL